MRLRSIVCAIVLLSASHAVMSQTILTVSSWLQPTHTLSVSQKKWCEALEKESNSSLKCNILPKAVAAPPGTFDAVRDGMADVSYTVDGYTPGRFIFTKLAEFPFQGESAIDNSIAYTRIYQKYFAPLKEHRGVKVLGVFTQGPGKIYTTKVPATSSAEVAKLKFRSAAGNINDLAKAMGWSTALKPATEVFELLSTGIVDGAFFTDESVASFKLNMIKHSTTFPGGLYNVSFVFMMNPDKYKSLSTEHKAIVDRLSGEYVARLFGQGWDDADKHAREGALKEQGVQFHPADQAFINEIKVKQALLEDNWAAQAESKGLKNAKAILSEFRGEIAKLK